MAHTNELGRSTPAKSKVAAKMRGALKGRKNVARVAETKALTKGGSELHGEHRQQWGSPSALHAFKAKYGGPSQHKATSRGFASGKREINRLKARGK